MLDTLALFSSLTEGERSNLSLFCQTRSLSSWECLFNEWDAATAMYIVLEGSLVAYRDRSTGKTILGEIGVGNIAGEMAIFWEWAPKKRLASVDASEKGAKLLVILDTAITELSRKHEELYKKITRIISDREAENADKITI